MRPSQLMWSYGIGAMIDLPRLSVMVEGLDRWSTDHARVISEDRLLAAVRRAWAPRCSDCSSRRCPPRSRGVAPNDPIYRIGVPIGVFPKWLRCPRCKLLSDVDAGVFTRSGTSTRPDEVQYLHKGCSKQGKGRVPSCVPARFVVACRAGHLDDFPWRVRAPRPDDVSGDAAVLRSRIITRDGQPVRRLRRRTRLPQQGRRRQRTPRRHWLRCATPVDGRRVR
ncbi:MAG: hypothetical protein R2705_13495 [Ilumatobacteraceae bacterium]